MPFFLMALGALLLIGGVYGLFLGLPYLVLERGFTQAIIGSVMVTGGLVLVGIGLLMRDMRRLFARHGMVADAAPLEAEPADAAIPAAGGMAGTGLAMTGLAAAGAVAAGTVLAGKETAGTAEDAEDALQAELPLDGPTAEMAARDVDSFDSRAAGEEAPAPDDVTAEVDGSRLDAAVPEDVVEADEDADSAELARDTPVDEVPFPDMEVPDMETPDVEIPDVNVSALPPPMPSPPDDDDPFERLRRSLMLGDKPARSDALAAGMSGAAAEGMPAGPATADMITADPKAIGTMRAEEEDAATDPAIDGFTEEAAGEDDEAPSADADLETGPEPADGPTASDEGIVSVRRIGDSTYTMYVDGSVAAETPTGMLRFASVAELKAHLITSQT